MGSEEAVGGEHPYPGERGQPREQATLILSRPISRTGIENKASGLSGRNKAPGILRGTSPVPLYIQGEYTDLSV